MRRPNLLNGALVLTALGLGFAFSASVSSTAPDAPERGSGMVTDATGAKIPVRDYARIVSMSTIADQVLVRVIDPSRVLAVSGHTLRTQDPAVYRDKVGIERVRDLETIIGLRPDIVFINNFVDRRYVARLKDAGLTVFDLGPMQGLDTLPGNIRQLTALVGAPERGEKMVRRLTRDLDGVAADIPEGRRHRGLYVGIHGDRLYGGTRGTSFHHVMQAAGLVDVAAEAGFVGWPAYTSEQLLSLDPPWIVTNPGTEQALCRHPGLAALEACVANQVRSIETDLLTDPGLGMVDAARAIRAAVYGGPG